MVVAHDVRASPEFSGQPAVIMSLSWVTATISGHTKKVTMNAIWLLGYSVGQMVSPQPWKEKYKPRNYIPWAILMGAWAGQIVIILLFYYHIKAENRRRDDRVAELRAEHPPGDENAGIDTHPELEEYGEYSWYNVPVPGGGTKRERVEKRFLDLTDKENLAFRYVL
jgi:ACS family allantoate permease-like MFS transporter